MKQIKIKNFPSVIVYVLRETNHPMSHDQFIHDCKALENKGFKCFKIKRGSVDMLNSGLGNALHYYSNKPVLAKELM